MSLLMVVYYASKALIFKSVDLRDALQSVISVLWLARYNCYSSYIVFNGFYIIDLSVVILSTHISFIRVHAPMNFLSPVDTPLRRSAIFDLAISRTALLGFDWQGGFFSHKDYTLLLARLESVHK